MNTHTLTVLEYEALLASVCEQAQSTGGIALLQKLHPSNDLEVILSKRSLYQDLIDVRNHPLELPGLRTEELASFCAKSPLKEPCLTGQSWSPASRSSMSQPPWSISPLSATASPSRPCRPF